MAVYGDPPNPPAAGFVNPVWGHVTEPLPVRHGSTGFTSLAQLQSPDGVVRAGDTILVDDPKPLLGHGIDPTTEPLPAIRSRLHDEDPPGEILRDCVDATRYALHSMFPGGLRKRVAVKANIDVPEETRAAFEDDFNRYLTDARVNERLAAQAREADRVYARVLQIGTESNYVQNRTEEMLRQNSQEALQRHQGSLTVSEVEGWIGIERPPEGHPETLEILPITGPKPDGELYQHWHDVYEEGLRLLGFVEDPPKPDILAITRDIARGG